MGEALPRRPSGPGCPSGLPGAWRTGEEVSEAGPWNCSAQDQPSVATNGAEGGIFAGEPETALGEGLPFWWRWRWLDLQHRAAAFEVLLLVAVAEKAEVSDTDESVGEHVQEESADELGGMDLLGAPLAASPVVFVAEDDVIAFHAQQAFIGDRDAMGVACEVVDDGLRSAKRLLGEDDPVVGAELMEEGLKADRVAEIFEGSVELELGPAVGAIEGVNERLGKERGEDTDVNKKLCVSRNPTVALDGRSRSLNDAMGVWVVGASGAPGVEDAGPADACSEMLGIFGQSKEGFVRGLKQRGVAPSLIGSGEGVKVVGQGEYGMEVGHRKKLLCPSFDPSLLVEVLALGAMPIAAGVVDTQIAFAGIAAKEMATEDGSSAQFNSAHGGALLRRDRPASAVKFPVVAENVRDFES